MAVHAMNALAEGFLIINADDLGYDATTTDAILESFRQGAITSATAMVHMADSERAARLARESGLPAGLHLNLIEPFTGAAVPPRVREDQEWLCGHFASKHRLRWLYDPRIRGLLQRTIEDQLNEFERLYGEPPTHFDGHRHMHLSLNVVLGRTPLSSLPARRSFSYEPGDKSLANRAWREGVSFAIRSRFGGTRWFFSIRDLAPELGGKGLDMALERSGESAVEVMVHPGWEDERRLLEDPAWVERISRYRLGSYRDLRAA
jgi:hypothetical protein